MIVGILLAAGSSRRFGADKLLQPLADGMPLALRSAQRLRAAVDQMFVVIPPQSGALRALLAAVDTQLLVNALAAQGMGTSLACGVRASADADGWLIALADMPFIAPATLAAVATALRGGAVLAAPSRGGRTGHPVGFCRRYYGELADLYGDEGARALVQRDRHRLLAIPVDDDGIHLDIDQPGDLLRNHRHGTP